MKPVIQSAPSRTIIGVGGVFISALSPQRNNHLVIPELWHQFINRTDEISNRKDHQVLGCVWCLDLEGEDDPGRCYYVAGAEVIGVDDIPPGMVAREVPAGRYAVFIHKGSLENLGLTMRYIHDTWYPQSGHERRDAPEVEVYGPKFNPESEDSELEIWMPIV